MRGEIWGRLAESEVPIELVQADLEVPGALCLTDRRILFAGKGLVFRRRLSILSVPLADVLGFETRKARPDTELQIRTVWGDFKFRGLDREDAWTFDAAARRLLADQDSGRRSDVYGDVEVQTSPAGWALPGLLVAVGIGTLFWSTLAGGAVISLGILVHVARRALDSEVIPPWFR